MMIKKWMILLYGIFCYVVFNAVFLYFVGFLSNKVVPKAIDDGTAVSLIAAVPINIGLIALFGLAHSIMARRQFKQWWTRIIPAPAERSTYVLQSSLLLALIMWQWRPLAGVVWSVENSAGQTILWGLFAVGVAVILISTFLISHFEMTGLQQVFAYWRQQPLRQPTFKTPGFYKAVRHPMQLGILMACWITPEMTVGHACFALGLTCYILIGLYFEERDLVRAFGQRYLDYRKKTPKLVPGSRRWYDAARTLVVSLRHRIWIRRQAVDVSMGKGEGD